MLCTRACTHFLSPLSRPSRSLIALGRFNSCHTPYQLSIFPIKMSTTSTTTTQIVEHIVLFKVKLDTPPSKVTAMLNGLNGLISLDLAVHLTAGPLLRSRSSSLTFTHMLHTRFKSKDDLSSYALHPGHLSVVKESILPIIDDNMAVDWVVDCLAGPVSPPPGSAMKVTFLKLKEGLGDKEKQGVLGVIGGVKDCFPSIEQISFGENFSPARAKGFSIASIGIFPELSELEAVDSNVELVNSQKEKVRDLLESVLVLDYVIPPPQSASL